MRIEVRRLRKEFGDAVAVRDISFTIEGPAMVGVIGRSGAGKSTLLRMMNRLAPATAGEVLVDGVDVLSLRGRARRRWQRDCAMIFQQFNLVPRLDVITNVLLGRLYDHSALGAMLKFFNREERAQAVLNLERLGIADQALKRAEALSGGQQQRVAIARALMQNPVMMLADEPIASLDPMNAKLVMDALRDINLTDKKTIICNLHTLDTARTYCDRVIGMRAGEIVFDGPPSELTIEKTREIYGAGDEFNEATTSTSIDAPTRVSAAVTPSAPLTGAVAAGE